jgi:hypothetical protein
MRTFIRRLVVFYIMTFAILSVLKHIHDIPRKRYAARGAEKNLVKWKGFRERNDANVLFFGSSRMYNAIHPVIFDSLTGSRSYNMGTGSQSLAETYSYMKEALESNGNVKWVVVDLFERSFNVTDYMHLTQNARYLGARNRWELYYNSGLPRNLMNIAFPLLADVGYINIDIREAFKKETEEAGVGGNDFWISGYNRSEDHDTAGLKTLEDKSRGFLSRKEISVKQDRIRILDRIVRLCSERGVSLTFTCIPKSNIVDETEVSFFRNLLNGYAEIGYFTEFPPLNNLDIRSDGFHLNNSGAEKCTRALAGFMETATRDSMRHESGHQ